VFNSGRDPTFLLHLPPDTIFCLLIRLLSHGKADTLNSASIDIGKTESIDRAVKRERPRLLDFIRRRIRNESDAEDILQDVFFQLAASYSVTEPIENLTAWLFAVARNKLTDWYRKHRPAPLPGGTGEGEEVFNPEEVLFDPEDGPEHAYWRSTVWSELADALEELPKEQREVFVWHEIEGRSFKEIAESTGEPVNTLLSRKRYAVLALRERLQDLYDELELS
jgi:RNA polymerase sigma factor (sigma-70 family)